MSKFLTILISAAVVALAAAGFALSGLYDVSASTNHGGPVNWLLSTTARASIKRHARDITVPDLSDPMLVHAGVNDFEAMCVECHGGPGRQPGPAGQGLNPPAPDLARSATRLDAAQLFWVTKHGIRMTGMPAWGASHNDADLWPVVAFLLELPTLSAVQYQALREAGANAGHHSGSHTMATPSVTSPPTGEPSSVPHDHSSHSHDVPAAPIKKDAHDDDHEH